MNNKDLTHLTIGERLWIERHRRGETQAQAARRYGCARTTYLATERDARKLGAVVFWNDGCPLHLHLTLSTQATLPEALRLARRRSGEDMGAVADDVGISRATLLTWEKTGRAELVAFWQGAGWVLVEKELIDA